jgi:LysR family transcriptional regulator, nod-box dependent transcriptional activator
MRFKGFDLNLLVAIDVLLETRSVSRTAEKLHLSQPAVSAALNRIREYFNDDILVTRSKKMYPTALADTLQPRIRQALRGVDGLLTASSYFNPEESERTFRIVGSDYITAAILVPLVTRLAEIAPGIRIEILAPESDSFRMLEDGKIDLMLVPDIYVIPDHPAELLVEEKHVIVGWNRNPLFKKKITSEIFFAQGHVAVLISRERALAFGDRELQRIEPTRRIEVMVPSFTMVPWLVRGTDRLAIMHERLFRPMSETFPISSAPLPFDFPLMREMMQYHQARSDDEGLTWLRQQLSEIAAVR